MPLAAALVKHFTFHGTLRSPSPLTLLQICTILDMFPAANRATARHALQRANGNEQAAVLLLLDSNATPQEDDDTPSASGGSSSSASSALSAPRKGYYANVIDGKTSLTAPAFPEATAAAVASPSLPEITCDAVAKSIEQLGPEFKPAADQIRGYCPSVDVMCDTMCDVCCVKCDKCYSHFCFFPPFPG